MASEDDAETLTHEVAMYDQEEDAIDAFMGSASTFSATAEPEPTGLENRDESGPEPSAHIAVAEAAQSGESNRDRDPRYRASDDNRGNSSTQVGFNPSDDSDTAFSFDFPSIASSNQSSEFFGGQPRNPSSSSECHSPASQRRQQEHRRSQHTQPHGDDNIQQENEEFDQLMAATETAHQDTRSAKSLESKEREQEQQQQQHQQSYCAESRPDQQHREGGSHEELPDPPAFDPVSQPSYPVPTQEPYHEHKSLDARDPQTSSAAASIQQQEQESSPARPTSSSKPPPSSSTSAPSVGSKRAAPAPAPRFPGAAAAATASAGSAPAASPQPFSWNDILRVQNMIERCLQQYLSKPEILQALQEQAQVDPEFTSVVWQKLEEQNPSFFRAYSVQLQLKEQILAFNYLVNQQKEMMALKGDRSALSSALSSLPPLQVDARSFMRQGQAQQMGPSYLSGPAKPPSNQFNMPPPSPLPLPSPIKTDLDTHAFFT